MVSSFRRTHLWVFRTVKVITKIILSVIYNILAVSMPLFIRCTLFEIVVMLCVQVEERDKEIERLNRVLDGGRPNDVISLEAQNISNEKLIAHLNLQVNGYSSNTCIYFILSGRLSD